MIAAFSVADAVTQCELGKKRTFKFSFFHWFCFLRLCLCSGYGIRTHSQPIRTTPSPHAQRNSSLCQRRLFPYSAHWSRAGWNGGRVDWWPSE